MRIYMNALEAIEEIKRDLAEMGILVKPASMQDKIIKGDPNYETQELQNYCYTILNANSRDIPNPSQPWADAEFEERIHNPWGKGDIPNFINPGEAWKLRPEVWTEFIQDDGTMAYTYNERLWQNDQITRVIDRLKEDPDSRQLWISLWNPNIDPSHLGGISRVPCSLGYNIQIREGKLNLHYVMRSCDFATHFRNDIYLAIKLMEYLSEKTGYPSGDFTHTIFSLHVYRKDIANVF